MTFEPLAISGVWLIEPDVFPDDRGWFAPAWLPAEFASRGLDTRIAQASLASNRLRGTLRGMHFQAEPFGEAKVIRVTRGAVLDVAVDLRPSSPTYRQWVGAELSAGNRRSLYLPAGVAHGYQTLEDDTDVFYFVSAPYTPSHQRGVRWNDPAFAISWPIDPPTLLHPRDASYADFTPER